MAEEKQETHSQQRWVNLTMEVQVAFYSVSPIYSLSAGVWMKILHCKAQCNLQKPQLGIQRLHEFISLTKYRKTQLKAFIN